MSQLICHSWHVLHLLACFIQLQSLLRRSAVSNTSRSFAHLISLGLVKAVLVGGSPTTYVRKDSITIPHCILYFSGICLVSSDRRQANKRSPWVTTKFAQPFSKGSAKRGKVFVFIRNFIEGKILEVKTRLHGRIQLKAFFKV